MAVDLTEFKPQHLWKHFDALRQIPRPSKNEKAASDYVVSIAEKHGCEYDRDEEQTVVIRVPASPGREGADTIVLQSHLDMVCEKNEDVDFDFENDAIQLRREGDWLYAQGTTLGSDNGIGVAASLAMMDDPDVVHGPLELLFTVDEETGLTGAGKIQSDFLKGRTLINLDSEDEGYFSIGCAGGADTNVQLKVNLEAPSQGRIVKVQVKGLKGGHSGIDIHKNHANAIKVLSRMLWEAAAKHDFRIANIKGGNAHNAIPREAFADMVVTESEYGGLKESLEKTLADISLEIASVETDRKLTLSDLSQTPERVLDSDSQTRLLNLMYTLPHGVLKMAADIPGLVETSVNYATIRFEDGAVNILMSARSSVNPALRAAGDRLQAIGGLAGAHVESEPGYPGWTPNLNSPVLQVAKSCYLKLSGKEPVVEAVHAGLECGIIGEKYPGMDMVSIGPQIEHPHSPDERVSIPTVERFWELLKLMLAELA